MAEMITLSEDSESIRYLCRKDKRIEKVVKMVGPMTYTRDEDSYHFLVDTIIGQMLSNKAADVISERLHTLCGGNVCPEKIGNLSDEDVRGIGIAWSKVHSIRNLTEMVQSKQLDFQAFENLEDAKIIEKLTSVKGIGNWSAKMYLIFVLDRQDVLPLEDGAFLQGYGWAYKTNDYSAASVKKRCSKWSPYASIAARYLYRALDMGLTKTEFHLFSH